MYPDLVKLFYSYIVVMLSGKNIDTVLGFKRLVVLARSTLDEFFNIANTGVEQLSKGNSIDILGYPSSNEQVLMFYDVNLLKTPMPFPLIKISIRLKLIYYSKLCLKWLTQEEDMGLIWIGLGFCDGLFSMSKKGN